MLRRQDDSAEVSRMNGREAMNIFAKSFNQDAGVIAHPKPQLLDIMAALLRMIFLSAASVINAVLGWSRDAAPRDSSLAAMLGAKDPWNLDFPLFQWSPGRASSRTRE